MDYIPCKDRVFQLWLAPEFADLYSTYLYWYKHLLERLGHLPTLRIWKTALQDYDDNLLNEILSTGWQEVDDEDLFDTQAEILAALSEIFPVAVDGVSGENARQIIDATPPFTQIKERFSSLDVMREISTFQALHLLYDGLALLTETLIDLHGKQGELIAYDAMMARWTERQPNTIPVSEFIAQRAARFSTKPDEPDMFSTGLEVEFVHASESEVVTQVKECEWARYYQEHHPRVGYMLACSLDNAAYKSFNQQIRLQRTCTIMEGGEYCDFRVYALAETSNTEE